MDGTRESHPEWNESERQIPYDFTYNWNLISNTNELFHRKENHGHREQPCGCQGGGSGRDWESEVLMHATIAFGMNKQWDPAVEHWELYLVIYDGSWWKIMWEKEYIYVYIIYIDTHTRMDMCLHSLVIFVFLLA